MTNQDISPEAVAAGSTALRKTRLAEARIDPFVALVLTKNALTAALPIERKRWEAEMVARIEAERPSANSEYGPSPDWREGYNRAISHAISTITERGEE